MNPLRLNHFIPALCLWLFALWPSPSEAQVRVPGFSPSSSGLHFNNSFANVPLVTINVLGAQVPIGNAANGMCGGMVFTVMDYHQAGMSIPCDQSPPSSGTLFDYIGRRLIDSFNLPFGPARYMSLMDPNLPDHETWFSQAGLAPHGRAWVMIREEWPKIKADLDSGMLSPLALIRVKSLDPFQMGHNHQVMAYGYDLFGDDLTIFVYDPNHADDNNVTIALNIAAPEHTTPVTYNGGSIASEEMFCFFRPDYFFFPPPILLDQTPPRIFGPTAMTVSAGSQCSRPVYFGVSATDECGSATTQCQPPSGSTFSVGTSVVNCTATDGAGNASALSFTVTVLGPAPAASPGGTGLLATYYDDMNFMVPTASRIEAVNFDWGTGSPVNGVGPDTFSVRWAGQVVPRYSGAYTFYTWSDDGVRLWVNGQLLINNWIDHGPAEDQGTINLVAGQAYDITMDYYDNGGYAMAELAWASGCQTKEIIPASQLLPAAPDCPDAHEPTFSSDFNAGVPAGLTLFGAANVSGGYLKLTPAQNGQYGIAYLDNFGGGRSVQGFRATFKAALFGSSCCLGAYAADGFSFNLVPAATVLSNPGYGEPAEEGLATGLTVSFDTWDNGGFEAPAIEVKWLGQVVAHAAFQASQSPAGITDPVAASKEVVIDLERGGAISVSYGGALLINRVQTPYNAAVIGVPKWVFGARTGEVNDNHWIDDLKIVTPTATATAIPGLFNTGVDNQARPLPDNIGDAHYRLVSPSSGTPVAATAAGGFPIGPWLPDDAYSAWIAPTADTYAAGNSDYYYEIQFDLTGLDPATAVIQGQWAADNFGMDILINSVSTGQSHVAPGTGLTPFDTWQPFVVSRGFLAGLNTLTFVVRNASVEPNPTGLRVEMCGQAVALPPTLRIDRRSTGIVVSWKGQGYVLQTASSVAGAWSDWSSGSTRDGVNFECLITNPVGVRFYRLRESSQILLEPSAAIELLRGMRALPGDMEAPPVPKPELVWFDPMTVLGEPGVAGQAWSFHLDGDLAQDVIVSLDGTQILAVIENGPENPYAHATTPRYIRDEVTGVPRFVAFSPPLSLPSARNGDAAQVAMEFFQQLPWMFGTGEPAQQLQPTRVERDLDGGWHVVLAQTYAGLSVWGCELRVHLDAQFGITSISGRYERDPDVPLEPARSEQEAYASAITHWVAVNGSDQLDPGETIEPRGLVIFPWRLATAKGRNDLAYWFHFPDADRFVSAQSGRMIAALSREHSVRQVYDLNQAGSTTLADLQLQDGVQVTSNPLDPEALSADGAIAAVDGFWRNLGRNSWDNGGANMLTYLDANFDDPTTSAVEVNAFWNGQFTVFSTGLAAPDIVAHEFTHALTERTAGLVYTFESGALNESFSDVFGKLIFPTPQPWVIGAGTLSGGAGRDLQNPDVGNYASLIISPSTVDNGSVHTNSGIGNRVAVLISDGDGTTAHPGLGRPQLARIWWDTLVTRLSPWSTYADLLANSWGVTRELVNGNRQGVTLAGTTQPPRTFTQADPGEVLWAFRQVGLDLQLSTGWSSVPANRTTDYVFYQGLVTSADQVVSDVIVRIHKRQSGGGVGNFLGELKVSNGSTTASLGGGVVTATITQHGVGSNSREVHVRVTTANFSDTYVSAQIVTTPVPGVPPPPTPPAVPQVAPTVVHWCDIPFCGRRYGDIVFEGLTLPANCTVTDVELELVEKDGRVLGRTRLGQPPALDGGRGAWIFSSSVGGQSIEVRVRSWHDFGWAVRYRLIYWIQGNGCDLPNFTLREVGPDGL